MSTKIYIASNIWLDFWLDRTLNLLPAGYYAKNLLDRVISCEFAIVLSNFIFKELETNIKIDLNERMGTFKLINKLTITEVTKQLFFDAKKLAKERSIPISDAVRTLMARQERAILVSRDKHFKEVEDLVEVRLPEEL